MTARTEKALVSLGLQVILATGFVAIGQATRAHAIPPPAWLDTPLDRAVPLVPASVWVYATWYPAPLLLLLAERMRFRRGAAAVLLAFAACACGYLAWPVMIERPVATGYGPPGDPSLAALAFLYRIDPPVNVFPSFHAALAAILVALGPARGPGRAALVVWMLGICVSCVLTKQHYALDVVAGVAVGFAADRAAHHLLGARLAGDRRPVAVPAAQS